MSVINYHWDFSVLWKYREVFFPALWATVYLSVSTIIVGILSGALLAWMNLSRRRTLRGASSALIEMVRSLPPLVLLVWCYYCIPIIFGVEVSGIATVIVSLGVYSGVFYAEVFRSGIQTVDAGLIEAGLAVGMTRWQIFRRILAPISFRNFFPPFISQCILAVKNTSLAGYIAVNDILYMGERVSSATFRPIEVLSVVALTFMIVIIPLTLFARYCEARLGRKYAR